MSYLVQKLSVKTDGFLPNGRKELAFPAVTAERINCYAYEKDAIACRAEAFSDLFQKDKTLDGLGEYTARQKDGTLLRIVITKVDPVVWTA